MSVEEELANPSTVFMTIQALKKASMSQKVWALAAISEVLFERDWSYTSCLKCKKKVLNKEDKLFCDNCQDYVVGNTRYKVFVNVVDGTGRAVFLLWDEAAKHLIGMNAASVTEKMVMETFDEEGKEKQAGKIEQPTYVDAISASEALFKISIEGKHIDGRDSVYAVEKVCPYSSKFAKHRHTKHLPVGILGTDGLGTQGDTSWTGSDPEDDSGDDFESPDSKSGKRKLDDVFEAEAYADGEASICSTKVKYVVKIKKGLGSKQSISKD